MKIQTGFFALALILAPLGVWAAAPLSGTSGSNLTAWNGSTGSFNNNNWNQLTNSRQAPSADFGNCNALILRCAQPKCATGGCINMDIAYPIVYGCVMANETCKGHGEPLIQTIAAQIVANSTAKANDQAASAQAMASQQAAMQSEQQMQQMQQMQSQMAQQTAQQTAAVQAALEEQKQLAAQQAAEAAAARAAAEAAAAPSAKIEQAVSVGVSADVLMREQASGQILTQLENAEVALKALKKTMQNTFDYAGCDASGNNCAGPRRVKAFKQKAGEFFDPYETVLDEVYDALIMAQSLGVDITDIYMMLNGTCNVWGKYLCTDGQVMHYTDKNCINGKSNLRGANCTIGQVIPMNDGGCQLIQMLNNNEEVQQNWLYPEQGENSEVRVGCASEAIDNSTLFRGRKKQASIDIDILRRIIEQDSPTVLRSGKSVVPDSTKYCAVADDTIAALEKAVSLKNLPDKVCVQEKELEKLAPEYVSATSTSKFVANPKGVLGDIIDCKSTLWKNSDICKCAESGGTWNDVTKKCNCIYGYTDYSGRCQLMTSGATATPMVNNYLEQNSVVSDFQKQNESRTRSLNIDMCRLATGHWNFSTDSCDCTNATDKVACYGEVNRKLSSGLSTFNSTLGTKKN